MNEQLAISGSLKENSFLKLKKNNKIKHLEISYANLNDDWKLIEDLSQLRSISVKDSLIDFQSFYKALSRLKKLEKITYNYYCYFNKKPKEELKKIEITNKIFQIDFPKKNELNFDYNNYIKETYKNKFHSIFEIKNSEKIFKKLEKIVFSNFDTFQIFSESFDFTDKKLFKKNIYWGMDNSKLKKFKSLKNIQFNNGLYFDLLELNLEKFLFDIDKKKLLVSLNGYSKPLVGYPDEIKVLNILYEDDSLNTVLSKINLQLESMIKTMGIEISSLTMNEKDLFKNVDYSKPFKLLDNKKNSKILNHKFETLVFSNCYGFLNKLTDGRDGIKKTEIYIDLLSKQKNIKNIFFDISKSKNYLEENWEASHFSFLVKFIYEISINFPDIKFFIYHSEINKLLDNIESTDNFEKHLAYLINSLEVNYLTNRVEIINASKDQKEKFIKRYIEKGIDQLVVVDDMIYEAAKTLPDLALIYGEEIDEISSKFPKYNEQKYYQKRWDKLQLPLKETFYEILRIASFSKENFRSNNSKLTMLVKKNYLNQIDKLKFKKLYFYLGSPLHLITHNMDANEKNWKLKKKLALKNPDKLEEIEKIKNTNLSYAKQSLDQISNSSDIDENKLNIKDTILNPDQFELINDLGLNQGSIKEITHCWFEGVVTWQQRYIKLSELDKIISVDNLENLRLSDCIYFENLELPVMPKLKVLELHPNQNHHQTRKFREISKFENCPNLEQLNIENLNNFYNKNNYNITLGSPNIDWSLYKNDTFSIINLDLSRLHELKKLEKLNIEEIQATDLRKIKYLSNLKKLKLKVYHNTTDDYLSDYEPQPEVTDKDFLFLKESKKIEEINLRIGDYIWSDEGEGHGGQCYSSYNGNGDFLDFINYKIEKLDLLINFDIKNQIKIQDIITKITNRFLNLKELKLTFGFAVTNKNHDEVNNKFYKKIDTQKIDFSKITKLKNLTKLDFQSMDKSGFVPFKTTNFESIIKLKKLKYIYYCWSSVSLNEFRKARIAFKNESYDNPEYYDVDYDYYNEEEKKNWNRMKEIGSDDWDWISLEQRFLDLEKEENKKKFEKKTIIQKKKN